MSSSAEIVTRSLRRLGLFEPSESPPATDLSNGMAALNAMLAGWSADGINVSADVPLPAKHEEGVTALLAVRLSSDYPGSLTQQVKDDADRGMSRLMADYISAPLASFDRGLTLMSSRRSSLSIVPSVDDWVTLTEYAEFDRVLADDRHIYECIIAGTSGAAEPHGTGQEIADGTVTWRFIGFST